MDCQWRVSIGFDMLLPPEGIVSKLQRRPVGITVDSMELPDLCE